MIEHEELRDWYSQLPILPYGEISDEELLDYFKTILTWKKDSFFISEEIPDRRFTVLEYWLLLGLLNDCIEYGTSPRGAWLTEFGEDVLYYLNNYKFRELKEILYI